MLATPLAGVIFCLLVIPVCRAEWKALGPFGGSAAVVAADPLEPGTVYAGTQNALLFRSRDGGETWAPLPFPARLRATLHALAFDPQRKGLCFAAVAADAPGDSGLLRSRDGGLTWEALPGLAGRQVWSLAIWPHDTRIIAAGTQDGVYITRNGGDRWSRFSSEFNRALQPVVSLAFHPKDARVLYAGTPHLPWKTRDGGIVWRPVRAGMLDDSDVFSIQVDAEQPETVYASACSGIYRTVDGGARWTRLSGARDASYRTYFVALDPRNRKTVFAGTTHGLVRSTDGGATWRKLSPYATRAIAFDPRRAGRLYVATAEAGILRSDDRGETLGPVNRGFSNYHFSLLMEPRLSGSGQGLYTVAVNESGAGGLYRLAAGTHEWERLARPAQMRGSRVFALSAVPDAPGRLYAAGDRGLLLSSDGGKTWAALAAPTRFTTVAAFAKGRVVAGGESGLYRGDDTGRRWSAVALSGARDISRLIRTGTGDVVAISGTALYTSSDGVRWAAWPRLPGGEVLGVERTAQALWAATTLGLWHSERSGEAWRAVSGVLGANPVRAVCGKPGLLAAAAFDTIHLSRDGGASWNKTDPPAVPIGPITGLACGEKLLVLTQRQGVWEGGF